MPRLISHQLQAVWGPSLISLATQGVVSWISPFLLNSLASRHSAYFMAFTLSCKTNNRYLWQNMVNSVVQKRRHPGMVLAHIKGEENWRHLLLTSSEETLGSVRKRHGCRPVIDLQSMAVVDTVPLNLCIRVLTLSASEQGCLWKWGLFRRDNQGETTMLDHHPHD